MQDRPHGILRKSLFDRQIGKFQVVLCVQEESIQTRAYGEEAETGKRRNSHAHQRINKVSEEIIVLRNVHEPIASQNVSQNGNGVKR